MEHHCSRGRVSWQTSIQVGPSQEIIVGIWQWNYSTVLNQTVTFQFLHHLINSRIKLAITHIYWLLPFSLASRLIIRSMITFLYHILMRYKHVSTPRYGTGDISLYTGVWYTQGLTLRLKWASYTGHGPIPAHTYLVWSDWATWRFPPYYTVSTEHIHACM